MSKLKPCPMCSPDGWLDEEGKPVRAVRSKHHCEFCGSTGKLLVIKEDLENEGEEE
jgi:hypothetical protein